MSGVRRARAPVVVVRRIGGGEGDGEEGEEGEGDGRRVMVVG